ncbi:CHAT domain-containing protein [Candidatus Parabeggiatoa sp. HSG14]|uniref:CHAT domain-containing protein n=1 Tax=Candidatus Parabeggiatoa sp. HSG14 TaxID=3055593 RepID=UPI0025A7A183|nr:CHAT domain-containing protein [Thiotrichales bacterium HSG14]
MAKLITLNFSGDFNKGFEITLQEESNLSQDVISLPPNPKLPKRYETWRKNYLANLHNPLGKPIDEDIHDTQTCIQNGKDSYTDLIDCFKSWLKESGGERCRSFIRENLSPLKQTTEEEARVVILTDNPKLGQLPWHEWEDDLFKGICLGRAAIAVGPKIFQPPNLAPNIRPKDKVKILIIIGNSDQINTKFDRQILEKIVSRENAEIQVEEPKTKDELLRFISQEWHIFLFAGHSASDEEKRMGEVKLEKENVEIEDLKFAISKALEKGLQLMIFNSCDGVGLANPLAGLLYLPQSIVMRENIPDEVAQTFLQSFFTAFAKERKALYSSMLEARLSMRRFENKYPGVVCLPVIYQNSAVASLSWNELCSQSEKEKSVSQQDWSDASDVPVFFGRTEELVTLEKWIINDRCKMIAILGLGGIGKTGLSMKMKLTKGGIGKTDLSLKLAYGIQGEFDYVIWRKLLNAQPVTEILADIIKFLSNQQEIDLPDTIDAQVLRLLHYLKKHRCLLLLDNFEAILRGGDRAGQYQEGYEGYGYLLRAVGEDSHQSCLLLTSREKPQDIANIEGDKRPVRSLELGGLSTSEGKALFATIDSFVGSDEKWRELIKFFDGNPLALELAARYIKTTYFGGNISEFLNKEKNKFWKRVKFSKINELLDWHFQRLSNLEKEILYWLAINRESVNISELEEDIISPLAKEKLPETLSLLSDQVPLEKSQDGKYLTLQPMLIEYVTERFVEYVSKEIEKVPSKGKMKLWLFDLLNKLLKKLERVK